MQTSYYLINVNKNSKFDLTNYLFFQKKRTRDEDLVLAISHTAVQSLRFSNLASLQKHLRFIEVTVDTIEAIGGGGIRCMLAGVHFTTLNY